MRFYYLGYILYIILEISNGQTILRGNVRSPPNNRQVSRFGNRMKENNMIKQNTRTTGRQRVNQVNNIQRQINNQQYPEPHYLTPRQQSKFIHQSSPMLNQYRQPLQKINQLRQLPRVINQRQTSAEMINHRPQSPLMVNQHQGSSHMINTIPQSPRRINQLTQPPKNVYQPRPTQQLVNNERQIPKLRNQQMQFSRTAKHQNQFLNLATNQNSKNIDQASLSQYQSGTTLLNRLSSVIKGAPRPNPDEQRNRLNNFKQYHNLDVSDPHGGFEPHNNEQNHRVNELKPKFNRINNLNRPFQQQENRSPVAVNRLLRNNNDRNWEHSNRHFDHINLLNNKRKLSNGHKADQLNKMDYQGFSSNEKDHENVSEQLASRKIFPNSNKSYQFNRDMNQHPSQLASAQLPYHMHHPISNDKKLFNAPKTVDYLSYSNKTLQKNSHQLEVPYQLEGNPNLPSRNTFSGKQSPSDRSELHINRHPLVINNMTHSLLSHQLSADHTTDIKSKEKLEQRNSQSLTENAVQMTALRNIEEGYENRQFRLRTLPGSRNQSRSGRRQLRIRLRTRLNEKHSPFSSNFRGQRNRQRRLLNRLHPTEESPKLNVQEQTPDQNEQTGIDNQETVSKNLKINGKKPAPSQTVNPEATINSNITSQGFSDPGTVLQRRNLHHMLSTDKNNTSEPGHTKWTGGVTKRKQGHVASHIISPELYPAPNDSIDVLVSQSTQSKERYMVEAQKPHSLALKGTKKQPMAKSIEQPSLKMTQDFESPTKKESKVRIKNHKQGKKEPSKSKNGIQDKQRFQAKSSSKQISTKLIGKVTSTKKTKEATNLVDVSLDNIPWVWPDFPAFEADQNPDFFENTQRPPKTINRSDLTTSMKPPLSPTTARSTTEKITVPSYKIQDFHMFKDAKVENKSTTKEFMDFLWDNPIERLHSLTNNFDMYNRLAENNGFGLTNDIFKEKLLPPPAFKPPVIWKHKPKSPKNFTPTTKYYSSSSRTLITGGSSRMKIKAMDIRHFPKRTTPLPLRTAEVNKVSPSSTRNITDFKSQFKNNVQYAVTTRSPILLSMRTNFPHSPSPHSNDIITKNKEIAYRDPPENLTHIQAHPLMTTTIHKSHFFSESDTKISNQNQMLYSNNSTSQGILQIPESDINLRKGAYLATKSHIPNVSNRGMNSNTKNPYETKFSIPDFKTTKPFNVTKPVISNPPINKSEIIKELQRELLADGKYVDALVENYIFRHLISEEEKALLPPEMLIISKTDSTSENPIKLIQQNTPPSKKLPENGLPLIKESNSSTLSHPYMGSMTTPKLPLTTPTPTATSRKHSISIEHDTHFPHIPNANITTINQVIATLNNKISQLKQKTIKQRSRTQKDNNTALAVKPSTLIHSLSHIPNKEVLPESLTSAVPLRPITSTTAHTTLTTTSSQTTSNPVTKIIHENHTRNETITLATPSTLHVSKSNEEGLFKRLKSLITNLFTTMSEKHVLKDPSTSHINENIKMSTKITPTQNSSVYSITFRSIYPTTSQPVPLVTKAFNFTNANDKSLSTVNKIYEKEEISTQIMDSTSTAAPDFWKMVIDKIAKSTPLQSIIHHSNVQGSSWFNSHSTPFMSKSREVLNEGPKYISQGVKVSLFNSRFGITTSPQRIVPYMVTSHPDSPIENKTTVSVQITTPIKDLKTHGILKTHHINIGSSTVNLSDKKVSDGSLYLKSKTTSYHQNNATVGVRTKPKLEQITTQLLKFQTETTTPILKTEITFMNITKPTISNLVKNLNPEIQKDMVHFRTNNRDTTTRHSLDSLNTPIPNGITTVMPPEVLFTTKMIKKVHIQQVPIQNDITSPNLKTTLKQQVHTDVTTAKPTEQLHTHTVFNEEKHTENIQHGHRISEFTTSKPPKRAHVPSSNHVNPKASRIIETTAIIPQTPKPQKPTEAVYVPVTIDIPNLKVTKKLNILAKSLDRGLSPPHAINYVTTPESHGRPYISTTQIIRDARKSKPNKRISVTKVHRDGDTSTRSSVEVNASKIPVISAVITPSNIMTPTPTSAVSVNMGIKPIYVSKTSASIGTTTPPSIDSTILPTADVHATENINLFNVPKTPDIPEISTPFMIDSTKLYTKEVQVTKNIKNFYAPKIPVIRRSTTPPLIHSTRISTEEVHVTRNNNPFITHLPDLVSSTPINVDNHKVEGGANIPLKTKYFAYTTQTPQITEKQNEVNKYLTSQSPTSSTYSYVSSIGPLTREVTLPGSDLNAKSLPINKEHIRDHGTQNFPPHPEQNETHSDITSTPSYDEFANDAKSAKIPLRQINLGTEPFSYTREEIKNANLPEIINENMKWNLTSNFIPNVGTTQILMKSTTSNTPIQKEVSTSFQDVFPILDPSSFIDDFLTKLGIHKQKKQEETLLTNNIFPFMTSIPSSIPETALSPPKTDHINYKIPQVNADFIQTNVENTMLNSMEMNMINNSIKHFDNFNHFHPIKAEHISQTGDSSAIDGKFSLNQQNKSLFNSNTVYSATHHVAMTSPYPQIFTMTSLDRPANWNPFLTLSENKNSHFARPPVHRNTFIDNYKPPNIYTSPTFKPFQPISRINPFIHRSQNLNPPVNDPVKSDNNLFGFFSHNSIQNSFTDRYKHKTLTKPQRPKQESAIVNPFLRKNPTIDPVFTFNPIKTIEPHVPSQNNIITKHSFLEKLSKKKNETNSSSNKKATTNDSSTLLQKVLMKTLKELERGREGPLNHVPVNIVTSKPTATSSLSQPPVEEIETTQTTTESIYQEIEPGDIIPTFPPNSTVPPGGEWEEYYYYY